LEILFALKNQQLTEEERNTLNSVLNNSLQMAGGCSLSVSETEKDVLATILYDFETELAEQSAKQPFEQNISAQLSTVSKFATYIDYQKVEVA